MNKTLLNDDELDEIENEKAIFALMESYLEKTGGKQREFTSIRKSKELFLLDEMKPIQNILLMQEKSGKTIVLKQSSKNYSFAELQDVAERYAFTNDDIISLLRTGLTLEEIDQLASQFPLEIDSSRTAIREMMKKSIDPKRLEELQKKGIFVEALNDGSIQVETIQKITEVDENGIVKFEPEVKKSLELFEKAGVIKLPDKMYMKENEPTKDQRDKRSSLEVVSGEEKDKDRQNLEKMAADLNMKPDEIVSVIRIDDNENGSKLLNDTVGKDSTKYIIRTRNGTTQNKFIVAEEHNGKFEQSQGFEATPVAKEVGSLLKDTQGRNG